MRKVRFTSGIGILLFLVLGYGLSVGQDSGITWRYTSSAWSAKGAPAATIWGDYLYLFAGQSDVAEFTNQVERARILPDGSLGRWVVEPETLLLQIRGAGAIAKNGRVYVFGGQTGFAQGTTMVQYAIANIDGSLGSWQTTTPMLQSRTNFVAVESGGYVYAINGNSGKGMTSVEYAIINPDGSLGSWSFTSPTQDGRWFGSALAYGGYVYAIGGYGGPWLSSVEYAAINPDGSLAAWQFTSSMTIPRSGTPTVGILAGYLYAYGGDNGSCMPHKSGERALINPNGSLGTWTLLADTLLDGYTNTAYAQKGEHIYMLAGADKLCRLSDDVQFLGAKIPAAGDANCDGTTNISDAVYLIMYIFAGGPAPGCM